MVYSSYVGKEDDGIGKGWVGENVTPMMAWAIYQKAEPGDKLDNREKG